MTYEELKKQTNRGCDKPNSNNFYHWGGLLACVAIDYEEEKGDI